MKGSFSRIGYSVARLGQISRLIGQPGLPNRAENLAQSGNTDRRLSKDLAKCWPQFWWSYDKALLFLFMFHASLELRRLTPVRGPNFQLVCGPKKQHNRFPLGSSNRSFLIKKLQKQILSLAIHCWPTSFVGGWGWGEVGCNWRVDVTEGWMRFRRPHENLNLAGLIMIINRDHSFLSVSVSCEVWMGVFLV